MTYPQYRRKFKPQIFHESVSALKNAKTDEEFLEVLKAVHISSPVRKLALARAKKSPAIYEEIERIIYRVNM